MKCKHSSDEPVHYSDQSYFSGFGRYANQIDQKVTAICLSKVANSDVYLKRIADDYPNFPISKCFQEFQSFPTRYTNSRQIPSVSNVASLWVDKYTPQSCSSFLNTCPGILKLVQWLERWKSKNSKPENSPKLSLNATQTTNSTKKRLRPSPRYPSDDEFVFEPPAHKRCKYNSSNLEPVGNNYKNRNLILPIGYSHNQIDASGSSSSEEVSSSGSDEENYEHPVKRRLGNWRFKAFLLVGPHGTGKSALIYALAKDLGFKVFELNSSSRRSGKDITSQFQIALDSHHVAKDYLSTNFSTFQMITSKAISKPLHKSAANFFKPVSKMDTSCMKDASSTKDSGLNLNCNSIVLFDEVDVLFESDRGFWSGLSSMLQLARRPVILTASDPSIVHNLPVPAYVCHIISASLELVVPYIRVLCLAEGFDLDVQSAKSLIKSIQPPKLTFNKPSPEHLDLRRLINELQWLCISAPEEDREDDHMKYNQFISGDLIDDPLILVEKFCPSLCKLSGRSNYTPSVNPKCVIGNDLDDLFSTDIENDSNKITGKTVRIRLLKWINLLMHVVNEVLKIANKIPY
ncbi:ATPase family AAA domain-containing protein 5 [Schistosoma japonicum]|nr:ATPase family AAA domain-containing protein 5 [Schistosoma japonicum]KAH8877341.1 ATPase family AAA domain-containing protein 5 [Schistosoma japonicum]KAH8877342.1 ATPase family AAA domain-containing protein 5 [Schistosoma japonicum]